MSKSATVLERLMAELDRPGGQPAADGWIRTMDLIPLVGVQTLAGARGPIGRIVRAGFAEERRVGKTLLMYRLSSKFATWADAAAAAKASTRFVAPAGWVTLSQYARKHRRTRRGLQYRIDGADLPTRIYKMPRPVPHYRRTDLDRLLRKR